MVKCKKRLFIFGLNRHAPIGYDPGVTMNSNILNGNHKEMIVRLNIKNSCIRRLGSSFINWPSNGQIG